MPTVTDQPYAIGVMSGTSVDGIDLALLQLRDDDTPILTATHSAAFPDDLKKSILGLMQPGENEIDRAGEVHRALGLLYGDAVLTLLKHENAPPKDAVAVIGCHGQTVRHRPDNPLPFTLQLGCGATIAQVTGITTVTDFRSADMAAGGQGAPFAPFFHHALFAKAGCHRAIVNLGGIANITLLNGDDGSSVIGFDSGPANGLMDAWIQKHLGKAFDENGAWARGGQPDQTLLSALLEEPYLHRTAPKSTGRELFNLSWLETVLSRIGKEIAAQDVQHTLGCFTAKTVADGIPAATQAVYLCGGGAQNPWLAEQLVRTTGKPVSKIDDLGIPSQWIESAAFAWMANQTIHRQTSSLPSVTGASAAVVNGAIYYSATR